MNTDNNIIINMSDGMSKNPIQREERTFSKAEKIFSFVFFALAFCFVKSAIFDFAGYVTTLSFIAVISSALIFFKLGKHKINKLSGTIFAVLYIFSFVFSITDNNFIKFLTSVFIIAGITVLAYAVGNKSEKINRFLPYVILKSALEYPLAKFDSMIYSAVSIFKKKKFGKNTAFIFIGLLIACPLTLIVGALLMSADKGVKNLITSIFSFIIPDNIFEICVETAFAISIGSYLFGAVYAALHKENLKPLDEFNCLKRLNSAKVFNNIIIYTAVTPICLLYIIFFCSQANYFLSAFSGILPEGYLYSEYARSGFFELFAITIINLIVIALANLLAEKSGEEKTAVLKIYSIILCIFTLLMIAVAISKMCLYISACGLTRRRLYTSWFMILEAVFFILIIVKQIRFSFNISKWGIIAFTFLFGVLCFSRPDAIIASFNINMYESGYHKEIDKQELSGLSADGQLIALQKGVINTSAVDFDDSVINSNISVSIMNAQFNN